ncbi:hypothetical protein MH117_04615 [Paenibacillus sp. ACRRX]|uniref:hypothetical protein n=1 Tax=unclassified Paenibacillus TaxID=185978 RepID=UPI001EF5E31C|nr:MULTISPECIES: hypothetical protein [unclassified Paenibacillus]MCG7406691.1 hypothetical protein [Paenibacillus sp. ACRRX]MDK8179709.1 hypothetical protein [Paenibacillus sp. UMB4589-SE434]
MDNWKNELFRKAWEAGIIKDPQWCSRLDEPAPLWVMLDIALKLNEMFDPPHKPFD